MKPRFAIFYADKTVIDDGEDIEITMKIPKAWAEAQHDGVQFVVCRRYDGKMQVLRSYDIYMTMPNGELMATNDPGAQLREMGIAKYGTWIPDKCFRETLERANAWRKEQAEEK